MKLLKVLVAALLLTAMVTPAIAEDRLSLSGEMRVRGFIYDYEIDPDISPDKIDDSGAWNDQRFRVAGKLAVAEGVSVNFRFDATESDEDSSDAVAWGGSTKTGFAPYSHRRGDIQFDKAYLQVEKGGFTVSAGQMYFGGFGTGRLVDTVGTGFTGKYDAFVLHHVKQYDDNNGNDGFAPSNSDDDRHLTAAKYTFKGDGWGVTPMVSYVYGDVGLDQTDDYERLGLGVMGNVTLGPVLLKGEMNYFDGSFDIAPGNALTTLFPGSEGESIDEVGTQLYLDASMAATDNLRVGAMLFYADSADDDEIQVTSQNMPIFADWHPEQYGYWATDMPAEFQTFNPSTILQSLVPTSDDQVFGQFGGGGVTAGQLYADLKATEDLSMKFAAMYFAPEDDENVDYDGYTLNAGLAYKLAENTTLTTHINYTSISAEDVEVFELDPVSEEVIGVTNLGDVDYDVTQIISGIQVKF